MVGVGPITTVIKSSRLRWAGHVIRKSDEDWVKKNVRIQIRVRTTPPHVLVQTSGVVPGPHVDLILIVSSLRPHASSIGRWIHTVSYRSNMPCQVPRTRAGNVAPRDVSLERK